MNSQEIKYSYLMMRQIKWGSKGLISESSEKWRTETVETPTLLYWFTLNSDQIEWFFWFPISINENLIIKSLYDLGLITLDVQPYFQFHCFFSKNIFIQICLKIFINYEFRLDSNRLFKFCRPIYARKLFLIWFSWMLCLALSKHLIWSFWDVNQYELTK